ncbi:MAG: class II fructose-bisphosphate aldolase [Propionibacteriaceae bacterium]|nr:class II fructose-bisphosphate aldolase [Propionibacteriaceae bacterium]
MSLATTQELLRSAASRGLGIGAFNVITLEYAEAIVSGAEQAGSPVILQLSENATRFHHGNMAPIAAAMREIAVSATVPVSLHLDHVEDQEILYRSADAGFSSIMFDAGSLPYQDNVEATRKAAGWAHARGLSIEAELGYVGGKDTQVSNAHSPGIRTDPGQAAEFVTATEVDALAVAVGSSHAMTARTALLDAELIRELRAAVPVPLVLHGSSGVSEENLAHAVECGIVKVNVGTILSIAYTSTVRSVLARQPSLNDPRQYLSEARDEIAAVVANFIALISGSP